MKLDGLRLLTSRLNGEATVTVDINGVLYDLCGAVWTENHDHPDLPRIVFDVAPGGYRYGLDRDRRG